MTTRSTRRAKSAGVRSPDRPGRRDAETVDAGSPAGGGGRRLRRADSGAAGLSRRLLQPQPSDSHRDARAAGAESPRRAVFDRAVRPGSAFGEGAGERAGRDVCAGRIDAHGQGDHRRAVRAHVLGEPHQPDQHEPGRRAVADSTPWGVRRTPSRRSSSRAYSTLPKCPAPCF